MHKTIIVLDSGSKGRFIASKVREYGVYCEVLPFNAPLEKIEKSFPSGIILSGPYTDENTDSSIYINNILKLGVPLLCINCNNITENIDKGLFTAKTSADGIHTDDKMTNIKNFLFNICSISADWNIEEYAKNIIRNIKEEVKDKPVICALSGGVDSSVAAALVHKAIGRQLICIFVDHGLLRKNEGDQVQAIFKEKFDMNFIRVDAKDRFLNRLSKVEDPETKRKIIGEEFIRVFEEEAKGAGHIDFLVQGTIYPDIIESGSDGETVVKSHHNVGGMPDDIEFRKVIEPLRNLFKDEVRKLGIYLGLPEKLVQRQPFPGPGLAVRVIGDITEQKLDVLREADAIFREEIEKAGLNKIAGQYFAVLTNIKSVGVTDNKRTYDYTVALRCVSTTDFMTADFVHIPYDILNTISTRITKEVPNVNRVVYDITSKPPATIEWE